MITLQAIPNTNQVVISNETLSVTIVDGHSATFSSNRQLQGSSLITILGNLLRETAITYLVKASDQDWLYNCKGTDTIDIFSFEEDGNPCYLEINDNTEESIELFIVEGDISIFRSIFGMSPN